MATTERNLSIHDVIRPEPPPAIRAATAAWFLAVGAGIAESVLGVIGAVSDGAPVLGLVAQVLFRAVVYGGLLVVIDRYFRQGRRWSRPLLAVLLGVVGMATLVVGPISWLVKDGDFGAVDFSVQFVAFAVIRTVHVLAVIAGVVLMYQPARTGGSTRKRPEAWWPQTALGSAQWISSTACRSCSAAASSASRPGTSSGCRSPRRR